MSKEISFESLCEQLEPISIEFFVDYSLEDSEDNLGALSPFIIDADVDTRFTESFSTFISGAIIFFGSRII